MRVSLSVFVVAFFSLALTVNAQEDDRAELKKRIEKLESALAEITTQVAAIRGEAMREPPKKEDVEQLVAMKDELRGEIEAKENEYAEFRNNSPFANSDSSDILRQCFYEIEQKRSEILTRTESIKGDLASINEFEESADEAAALKRLVLRLLRNPGMASAFSKLDDDIDLETGDLLKVFKVLSLVRLESLARRQAELDLLGEKERLAAKELVKFEEQCKTFEQEIKRKAQLYEGVVARLETMYDRLEKHQHRIER